MKTHIPFAALVAAAAAIAAGCGGSTTPTKPKILDCSSVADTTVAATVSFQNDIRPLFLSVNDGGYGCGDAACHGGLLISSNYSVDSHALLLEQGDEAKSLGICAIKPGDPDASYLYQKLTNASGISGVRMPYQQPPMAQADLQKMRTWILEGARDN